VRSSRSSLESPTKLESPTTLDRARYVFEGPGRWRLSVYPDAREVGDRARRSCEWRAWGGRRGRLCGGMLTVEPRASGMRSLVLGHPGWQRLFQLSFWRPRGGVRGARKGRQGAAVPAKPADAPRPASGNEAVQTEQPGGCPSPAIGARRPRVVIRGRI
jgi:hypothetical protein